jgi:hypothetical protein
MNERYEQLMAQAWIEFAPDAKAVTKRFAELIVKECQTVVEWAISVDSTIDRVPVLIKEHFGVEE